MKIILAGALALSLAACASGSGSFDPASAIALLDAGYQAYCAANSGASGCSAADRKKEQDAAKAALDGAAAYAAGTLSMADLQPLIDDLAKLVADLKAKH